jgi:hypothetical protein
MKYIINKEDSIEPTLAWIGNYQHSVYTANDVNRLMRARCLAQGHEFEQCISAMFQLYYECKWCGQIK